jgi:ABC-type glycerol-3-phosphate transport system substrate-binding protein
MQLKKSNSGNYFTVDATNQTQIMKEGKTAMALIWSDYLYDLELFEEVDFSFNLLPGAHSPLAGGSYYVNKHSSKPDLSFKTLVAIMQPDLQTKLAAKGLCSPLISVYDNPSVKMLSYSKALKKSIQRGSYVFEADEKSDLTSQIITEQIQSAWSNKISVEEASEKIINDLNQLIKS